MEEYEKGLTQLLLENEEYIMKGLARDRKKLTATPIVCSECGTSGGTLTKVADSTTTGYHYEHTDRDKCMVMRCMAKEGK